VHSGIKVKVFRSVNELGKDAMDSIADDPFFTFGWFRTIETQQTYDGYDSIQTNATKHKTNKPKTFIA